jgi:hypothetical protein
MKLVQFYRGEIPTEDGDFISDVFSWGPERLEGCHSYIQWLFPLVEGSMFHPEVPCLNQDEMELFRKDPTVQQNLGKSRSCSLSQPIT